jgi:hypothetical protein
MWYNQIEILLYEISPFALFEASNDNTLCPPADSPKIVTLFGLPPNRNILI